MRLWKLSIQIKVCCEFTLDCQWPTVVLLMHWNLVLNWLSFVNIENLYIVTIFHWTKCLKVYKLQLQNCKSVVYLRLWLIRWVKFIHLLLWILLGVYFHCVKYFYFCKAKIIWAWQICIQCRLKFNPQSGETSDCVRSNCSFG